MSRRKAERRLWAWGSLFVGLTLFMAIRSNSIQESALILLSPIFEGHAWVASGEGKVELRISSFGDLNRVLMGDQRLRVDRAPVGAADPRPGPLTTLFSRGIEFTYAALVIAELLFLVGAGWIISKRYRKIWRWLKSRPGSARRGSRVPS